jgi:hypothetical protein
MGFRSVGRVGIGAQAGPPGVGVGPRPASRNLDFLDLGKLPAQGSGAMFAWGSGGLGVYVS